MASGGLPESRAACLAVERDPEWINLPPIESLKATVGYGTDRSAEPFAWAVMVLSSRSLGGDLDSATDLRTLLSTWAAKGAFSSVKDASDAYYALKRTLLPVIAAYAIEQSSFDDQHRELVRTWIQDLVARANKKFGSEVDLNNHRTLLDSVLASWGVVAHDDAMFEAGLSDAEATLATVGADGSFPLEARRGARAAWYMRQVLASMFLIAEAAEASGREVYSGSDSLGRRLLRSTSYLANITADPALAFPYSAVNFKPGKEYNFTKMDLAFTEQRPTARNYLSFLDIVGARFGDSLPYARILAAENARGNLDQARIDEFVGGNAPCFWGGK